jgi:hypothetical protein
VGSDGNTAEPTLHSLVNGCGALNAFAAQAINHLRVVDDVANGRDRAGGVGRRFNNFERAAHAPAIAKFPGNDHALCVITGGRVGRDLRWGGDFYDQM